MDNTPTSSWCHCNFIDQPANNWAFSRISRDIALFACRVSGIRVTFGMLCSAARRRFRWIPLRDRQRHLFRARRTEEICALCERGIDVLLFWLYAFVIRLATGMVVRCGRGPAPSRQVGTYTAGVSPIITLCVRRTEISTPLNATRTIQRICRTAQVSPYQKQSPLNTCHRSRGPDGLQNPGSHSGVQITQNEQTKRTSMLPYLAAVCSVFSCTPKPTSVPTHTFRGAAWNQKPQIVVL